MFRLGVYEELGGGVRAISDESQSVEMRVQSPAAGEAEHGAITCRDDGAGRALGRISLVVDVTRQLTDRRPPPLPGLSRAAVTVVSAAIAAAAAMAQYKGAASEAGRAMHLMKKREKQREQMEQMKQRIAEVRAGPGRRGACAPRGPPGGPAPLSGSGRPWAAG